MAERPECTCGATDHRHYARCARLDLDYHVKKIGRAATDDPASFWSLLTPAQCLALLRAAPRVAGEWEPPIPNPYPELGAARAGADGRCVAVVYGECRGDDGRFWETYVDGKRAASGKSPSLTAAKSAADAALRAAGWLLVDEAEAEGEGE